MLNAFCCKPDRARMLAERGLLIESDDDRHESFDAGVVELYRRATAADGTADARSRIAALREAHVRAGAAAAQRPTAARLGTFARIALAWGERSEAVAALQRILKGEALEGDAGELFLSPSARFDTLSARGDQQRWFSAAVLEAYEESRSFSSYFTAPESQGLIRAFDALGFPGESMRRRAALVAALGRMRPGESVRLSDALPQLQGLP
jgi:hypothetical protein